MTESPFAKAIAELLEDQLADWKLRAGFTRETAVAALAFQVEQDRNDYTNRAAEDADYRYDPDLPELLDFSEVAYDSEYATEAEADAAADEHRAAFAAHMEAQRAAVQAAADAILAVMTPGHEYGISDPLFEVTVPITSHRSQALSTLERNGGISRIPRTTPRGQRSDAKLIRN